MSKFQRTVTRTAVQDRLEAEVDRLSQFEIRALLLLGCYEAFAPNLPDRVVKVVSSELMKNPPKNKQEFLAAAKNLASMEIATIEYEQATSDMAPGIPENAESNAPAGEPGSPDGEPSAVRPDAT